MASRKYALEAGGPTRLELRSNWRMNAFTVFFDGTQAGVLGGKDSGAFAVPGQSLVLPDGSTLNIAVARRLGGLQVDLLVERNGMALPGSGGDPLTHVRNAGNLLYFIAGLNLLLGVVAMVSSAEALTSMGIGLSSAIEGVVFGVLALFTHRRSRVALGLAMALFIVDGIIMLGASAGATSTPPIGGILVKVFFLLLMWRGFAALGQLKATSLQAAAPPSP